MQTRRRPASAAEVMRQLEADPDWVARRNAQERDRAEREERSRREQSALLRDLATCGTSVTSVWDLVNTATPYPHALRVLLSHLSRPYNGGLLEGIARALAVKEARPIAWNTLVTAVRDGSLSQGVADGMMVAISAMARPADLHTLFDLIQDRSLGACRGFLVRNLMRSKRPEAREVLLRLQDDPDLRREIMVRLKTSASS
jgi:hypothetical protein